MSALKPMFKIIQVIKHEKNLTSFLIFVLQKDLTFITLVKRRREIRNTRADPLCFRKHVFNFYVEGGSF